MWHTVQLITLSLVFDIAKNKFKFLILSAEIISALHSNFESLH